MMRTERRYQQQDSTANKIITDNDVPNLGYGAYLNISALCLLQLEPDAPQIDAFAYFGDDGRFNALVDYLGFAHYISQDVLNVASHDVDYMNYKKIISRWSRTKAI
jgi:hypothetical protein